MASWYYGSRAPAQRPPIVFGVAAPVGVAVKVIRPRPPVRAPRPRLPTRAPVQVHLPVGAGVPWGTFPWREALRIRDEGLALILRPQLAPWVPPSTAPAMTVHTSREGSSALAGSIEGDTALAGSTEGSSA